MADYSRITVIEDAFRRLGIKAEDESLTADQFEYAGRVLDSLHAELSQVAPMPFWPDNIPQNIAIPLANLLAVEIGPSYGVAVEPRGRALARLFAVARPDDRPADVRHATPEWF